MKAKFVVALALTFCACDLNLLTSSATSSSDDHSGGVPTPTATPSACVALTCTPVPFDSTGKASSFRVTHSCGSISLVCTEAGGAVQAFDGVASGVELDPLAGGGTYTCRSPSGVACTVGLDS